MLHAAQRTCNVDIEMRTLRNHAIYLCAKAAKRLNKDCSLSIDVGASHYPRLLQWLVLLRLVPTNFVHSKSRLKNTNLRAMMPGISCSAISISLRPYTCAEILRTQKSELPELFVCDVFSLGEAFTIIVSQKCENIGETSSSSLLEPV
jgi:hypothetical protein